MYIAALGRVFSLLGGSINVHDWCVSGVWVFGFRCSCIARMAWVSEFGWLSRLCKVGPLLLMLYCNIEIRFLCVRWWLLFIKIYVFC